MSLIKGFHHAAIRCKDEAEFQKARDFYVGLLGLDVVREWDGGMMLGRGTDVILEIFPTGRDSETHGIIQHFAFEVEDSAACAELVSAAGYEVFDGPRSLTIDSEPPLPITVSFCYGPAGEEVEFFEIRN